MFREETSKEDLKSEIYLLKKQNFNVTSENNILKVKIRKLQDECVKKDKQINALLDPQKNSQFRKVISERGAHILINLKEKNERLQKQLQEKELLTKRLQNQLETIRLYWEPSKKSPVVGLCLTDLNLDNETKLSVNVPQVIKDDRSCDSRSEKCESDRKDTDQSDSNCLSNSCDRSNVKSRQDCSIISNTLLEEVRAMQKGRKEDANYYLNENSIDCVINLLESLKTEQASARKTVSPFSDLDRAELLCETPHEEIQQLQRYFLNILNEVDQLKLTIEKLEKDQQKTEKVLKTKDENIKELAEEVKGLKKRKTQSATVEKHKSLQKHSRRVSSASSSKGKSKSIGTRSSTSSLVNSEDERPLHEIPYYRSYVTLKNKQKPQNRKSQDTEVKKLWEKRSSVLRVEDLETCVAKHMPVIEECKTDSCQSPHESGAVETSNVLVS